MALTRARPVWAADDDRAVVETVIFKTLSQARREAQLVQDVIRMRGEMAAHKKPAGSLDVKLVPGGLVDLEFVVPFHQLQAQIAFDPRLPPAIVGLASAGLVEARMGEARKRVG